MTHQPQLGLALYWRDVVILVDGQTLADLQHLSGSSQETVKPTQQLQVTEAGCHASFVVKGQTRSFFHLSGLGSSRETVKLLQKATEATPGFIHAARHAGTV